MTERERARYDSPGAERTTPYDAPGRRTYPPTNDIDTAVVAPRDLVRWGPVIAGLFAAIATLITLGVLGLAIGLAAYDPGDPARNFGIGSSIWGAISALIAFGIGGWLAGRTAALSGRTSGILQGAMVWFVAIPLLIFMFGSGLSAAARAVGGVATTAAEVAAPVAGQAAEEAAGDPAAQATAQAGGQELGQAAQATAQALQAQVTPERVEQASDVASRAAWGTLLALGLSAAAAIGGGYMGARARPAGDVRVA